RGEDEQEELEELGLPVLRHVDEEARGGDEVPEGQGRQAVLGALLVRVRVPGQGLRGDRREEEGEEEQAEPVVPEAAAHHGQRPAIPRPVIAISPTATMPVQAQKTPRTVSPPARARRRSAPGTGRAPPRSARRRAAPPAPPPRAAARSR